jgi:hypothetical protein
MNYIITEDSKAGYQFWKEMSSTFGLEIKVISSGGFRLVMKTVINTGIKKGDTLLLAVDKVAGNREVYETVIAIQMYMNELGAKVSTVKAYCFEEILLSFRYLLQWCDYDNSALNKDRIEDKLTYITSRDGINNGRDYTRDKEVRKYMEQRGLRYSKESKRERFAYYLLNKITYGSSFFYKKGRISDCWYVNCCKFEYNKRCGIKENAPGALGVHKMMKVVNNSLLADNNTLKEMINKSTNGYIKESSDTK